MGADGWGARLVCVFPAEMVAIYSLFLPLLELDINTKLVQNIKLAEVANGTGKENV
jgi:4-hydroxy-tetrahydrodipicolinate synthase